MYTTFIDLKKAFDFIDRDMLLYKLLLNNVDGKIYHSIKSIYTETSACISINNTRTDWFFCKSGVKQGDNCSPTLFSIFVDDLVKEINNLGLGVSVGDTGVSAFLYADDIALISLTEQDIQRLQDTFHDWCKRWRVLINIDKSNFVHFRQGRRKRTEFVFKVGDNVLEVTEKYKYLGIVFSEKGDFNLNATNLAKGGGTCRGLGSIITKLRNLKEFGIKTFEKLYNSCVVPILDYQSSVWGYKVYNDIDAVQNRTIRYFLGVHRFTPKLAINGDVGWLPIKERRWLNILRYWNRLVNMDESRICKKFFLWDNNICHNKWSSEVKDIMMKIGLTRNFESISPCNLADVKVSLQNLYARGWSAKTLTVPKLRSYVTYKTAYCSEKYVSLNLKRNERSLLAQFRCGILPLLIETRRYVGEKTIERLCKICDSQQIEDETHFLLHCPFYSVLRNTLFSSVEHADLDQLSDTDKTLVLMNNSPRQKAKYLVGAYEKHKTFLYTRN